MEIVRREKAPDDFRVRQLRARDMLRGDRVHNGDKQGNGGDG